MGSDTRDANNSGIICSQEADDPKPTSSALLKVKRQAKSPHNKTIQSRILLGSKQIAQRC